MKVYSGECIMGVCGVKTALKDASGTDLFIGDIVAMASKDSLGIQSFYSLSVVVDHKPELTGAGKGPFIMGISGVDVNNDESWYVKKLKDWKDCVNGEHWKDWGFNYRA